MTLSQHLDKIAVFEAVCRAQGFSAAARELKRSQQAASRSIQELEKIIGERLIGRTNRRFKLSPIGQNLLAASQTILRTVSAFESDVSKNSTLSQVISIVTKEPIAIHIWADFVAWCKRTPDQHEVFEYIQANTPLFY